MGKGWKAPPCTGLNDKKEKTNLGNGEEEYEKQKKKCTSNLQGENGDRGFLSRLERDEERSALLMREKFN